VQKSALHGCSGRVRSLRRSKSTRLRRRDERFRARVTYERCRNGYLRRRECNEKINWRVGSLRLGDPWWRRLRARATTGPSRRGRRRRAAAAADRAPAARRRRSSTSAGRLPRTTPSIAAPARAHQRQRSSAGGIGEPGRQARRERRRQSLGRNRRRGRSEGGAGGAGEPVAAVTRSSR